MSGIKISLITVSYNSQKTIEDTLLSVKSQVYPDIEYIVVDGNSSDDTVAIIKRYPDVVTAYISERDNGIYDAMNKGISMATGDVIGFINADDILANPIVLTQVAENLMNENIDACYADLEYVDQLNLDKVIRFWKSSEFFPGLFSKGWSPPHPTFYVKKSVYNQYGSFSLDYKMGNDIELMLRFLEKYNINSLYVPQTWVKMRMGGVSNRSLGNIYLQNKEILKAARNNGVPIFVPFFLWGKIKNRIQQYLLK